MLRYFGIATLLDPAVSATIAATGLYLREGNPIEDLGYQSGREECGNARQKSVVLALMDLWSPYVGPSLSNFLIRLILGSSLLLLGVFQLFMFQVKADFNLVGVA